MSVSRRPQPKAQAATMTSVVQRSKWGVLATGALIAGFFAVEARGDSHEEIIVSHGYTNFGELKYGPDFPHLDYVNPDAPKGGEIAVSSQGTFDTFNNFTRDGAAAAGTAILYESILTATADDPYGSYCYLCTTLEYPESKDWVIFNLREDVTFSDGTPMTASDIAFAHNLIMEQGLPEYVAVVSRFITGVEVLDEYRVKFSFTEDAPRRDVIGFAGTTRAWSEAWFTETGARLDESTDVPFLGTGAYVLESFDTNRQVIYARDPDWWGAEHPFNIGQANFDRIRYEYFADGAAAFEAFKAGEYTFRNENSSLQWGTGYDFQALDNGWVIKEEIPNGSIGSAQAFIFNLRDEKFQDPRVREAIRLMFNFEWSNDTLFYGLYERVESFWQNTDLQAQGVPSEGELAILQPLVNEGVLDEAVLSAAAVLPPVNPADTTAPSRETLEQARALLADAGWVDAPPPALPPRLPVWLAALIAIAAAGGGIALALRSTGAGRAITAVISVAAGAGIFYAGGMDRPQDRDGLIRKDGETLNVEFLTASLAFERIINPYIENLERLGIEASLSRVDFAQYVDRLQPPVDFDMITHTMTQGFEPGTGMRQWFGSETAADSSRNLMGLQNEAVDRLMTTVIAAETLEDMTTATNALDRVLRAEGFWVPQWYKSAHTVAYYDMLKRPDNIPPYSLGALSFWWYDADRAAELEAAGAF